MCLDCIPDDGQRTQVRQHVTDTGKQLIELSWPQVEAFAGNMLQIQDRNLQSCVAMSTTARQALNHEQLQSIEGASRIIELAIPTLEMCGGGSVRCMMAENYLRPRN